MKKMIATATAAVLLTTSAYALELDTESLYAGGALAIESFDDFDSGVALVLTGGAPFTKKDEVGPGYFTAEAELTYSIVDSTLDFPSFFGTNFTYDVSVFSLGAYAAYMYEINEQFFVKPRIGLVYSSLSGDSIYSSPGFGLALGVQGGYKINDQFDATIGFNMLASNLTHLSAGIQYHF